MTADSGVWWLMASSRRLQAPAVMLQAGGCGAQLLLSPPGWAQLPPTALCRRRTTGGSWQCPGLSWRASVSTLMSFTAGPGLKTLRAPEPPGDAELLLPLLLLWLDTRSSLGLSDWHYRREPPKVTAPGSRQRARLWWML